MSRRFSKQFTDPRGTIAEVPNIGILLAEGTSVPSNGGEGYAPGCIYYDRDATANPFHWRNVGTLTSSKWVALGGQTYSNTAASAAHTATTDEALFDTQYSIPANTLWAGAHIHVAFQGIATATNAADTLTIKLYIGGLAGTALLTGTATDVANDNIFCGECHIIIRTIGASGTFVAFGHHSDVPAASGTATPVYEITASTAIDTTAAQVLGVGADWSSSNAGNSCRLDIFSVSIF